MNDPSHALVVYESMFGSTRLVADAVTSGLRLGGLDASLVAVGSAPAELRAGVDLLVVGGPTHAFSLSRPATRANAVTQGASPDDAVIGLREWLTALRLQGSRPPAVAAFDTRVTKVRWLPKAAGPAALRLARKLGMRTMARAEGFLVDDVRGPLVDGELERAVGWGRGLAETWAAKQAAEAVSRRA